MTIGRPRIDRSGQVFGRLTAVSFSRTIRSHQYWTFRCECGSLIERTIAQVRINTYNSCLPCRQGSNSHAWKGVGEFPRDLWTTTRHNAKSRGIVFNLQIEDMWNQFQKQKGLCALTGWEILLNKSWKTKSTRTASLDRVDSVQGYIPTNIQWVHRSVNYAKRNLPDSKFIELCLAVSKTRGCL